MHLKNEDGAALVLVLLLLLVGTVLVGVLLTTAGNYINVAAHEEGISKAFYNADSGVEFVKVNLEKINFASFEEEQEYYLEFREDTLEVKEDEVWITGEDLDIDTDDIEFKIKVKKDGEFTFNSTGRYKINSGKEYTKKIKFDLNTTANMKNFNLKKDKNKEEKDHYKEAGPGHLEDHITFNEWPDFDFLKLTKEFLDEDLFIEDDFDNSSFDHFYSDGDFNLSDIKDQNNIVENKNILIRNGNLDISSGGKKADRSPEVIKNSIIIVEGRLDIDAKLEIDNSIIFVKDYLSMRGASASDEWDNSMFFIYGENPMGQGNEEYYLDIRGTGNFYVNSDDLPDEFKVDLIIKNWVQL